MTLHQPAGSVAVMNQRMKCPHCSKVADFHNDFCTLCWSHRNKGKVLTEEMAVELQAGYAKAVVSRQWQAGFDKYQKLVIGPAVLLSLWCVYWTGEVASLYLKGYATWAEILRVTIAQVGFPLGGYLIGGCKALRFATIVVALAAMCTLWEIGCYLDAALDSTRGHPKAILLSALRGWMCAIILYGSYHIFRLDRKRAN